MSNIPVPRSYVQTLSDMLDTFLSRTGIKRLKIGPLLNIFESVAQSQTRNSQDIFNLLNSISIDHASGSALDNLAADENLTRFSVSASSGLINFLDTNFTKKSTAVYQGSAAPNVGTTALRVVDASNFPATGSIYIGRQTINYEGPLSYVVAPVDSGPYWTITLASGTTKFHNVGETVILAQGGVRLLPAGTVVQTPQGNVSTAIQFSTLYDSQIEDGETIVESVEVIANDPGIVGNVPALSITEVVGTPYVGASVTNTIPFTNGLSAENDESLRERIKNVRKSRQKGTSLAILTGIKGITSPEDNKTVISTSLISSQNNSVTLFIDDGTGYEETEAGVAQEVLMDSALGGEQYFQLASQRPIAKAFIATTLTSPFTLSAGAKLTVKVGGVSSEHSFVASEFKFIESATAYEVVAAINGNSSLLFSARTVSQGTKVALFSKSETNETIEMSIPVVGTNANTFLGFPSGINYTLRLYKNDNLLNKDGDYAIITSNAQSGWAATIADGDTLQIQVDDTATQIITINDSDFVTNNTGFTSVSSTNSLTAWATVFNAKIAGATAVGANGVLTLTSNLGTNNRAKIKIISGTLTTKDMFDVLDEDTGSNSDYTLNRNTGQLKLNASLTEGDSLVAATEFTRGYVESLEHTTSVTLLAPGANLWFVVDSEAEILSTGANSSVVLTISKPAGDRAR